MSWTQSFPLYVQYNKLWKKKHICLFVCSHIFTWINMNSRTTEQPLLCGYKLQYSQNKRKPLQMNPSCTQYDTHPHQVLETSMMYSIFSCLTHHYFQGLTTGNLRWPLTSTKNGYVLLLNNSLAQRAMLPMLAHHAKVSMNIWPLVNLKDFHLQ